MPNQGGGSNLLVANVFGVPNTVDPSIYYTPPGVAAQAISTADWYHFDGVYSGFCPSDLTQMGTIGNTIATANARYYWPMTSDHFTGSNGNWCGGNDFCHGFSSDPVIPPDYVIQSMPLSPPASGSVPIPPNSAIDLVTTGYYCLYQVNQLVYCPEDTGNVFHLYCEGGDLIGSPAGNLYAATTVSGSPVLSGIASTKYLTYTGTVSGTGIPGGATIIAVGAIATGATLGTSATVTISAVTGKIAIGAAVISNEFQHGGVPAGTTVLSQSAGITGGTGTYLFSHPVTLTGAAANLVIDDGTQVVMSANATANGTPTLTFKTVALSHQCGLFRSNDLVTWTAYGITHQCYDGLAWSSFQHVFRLGVNSYTSLGLQYEPNDRNAGPPGDSVFGEAQWSCSDAGLTFTRPGPSNTVINVLIGTRVIQYVGYGVGWEPVTVAGQIWVTAIEDSRNVLISTANPAVVSKNAHGLAAGNTVMFNTTGVIATGDQTLGSAVITNISVNTSSLFPGCGVHPTGFFYTSAGPKSIVGIPAGTTIASVDSASQVTLNIPGGGGVTQTQIGNNFQFFTLPAPILSGVNYFVLASGLTADTFEISATSGGAAISTAGSIQTGGGPLGPLGHVVPNGGMWVVRAPVDSGYNVLSSPATIRVSSIYDGVYPGPTYLQQVSSYLEDGIMYYYVERGFFNSATNFGFFDGATYNSGKGAFQEEQYDIYREIVDAVAAANAAPMGVTAACAGSTVTISCYDALPAAVTGYNVYRGTSSASFPTTVGTITASAAGGTTRVQITDASAPDQAIAWYKVVTVNAGVEQQSRIVSCYVSNSVANVNKHMKRVLNAGADPTTINRAFIDTVDAWLAANSKYNSMERFVDPRFGVVQSGGVVSKVFDYATTRLPRGRDFSLVTGSAGSMTASTSTYSSTGLAGTTPAWTNPNANCFGIFGGGLDSNGKPGALNPIRRKYEITAFAYYTKASSAGDITLLAMGDSAVTGNLALQHTSGAPGTASFTITDYDTVTNYTAVKACSGTVTDARVIAGTFGGTGNLIAYDNGTPGGSVTGLHVNSDMSLFTMLRGQTSGGTADVVFMNSGSLNSKFNYL
jgi:hypothetical protein